MRFLFFVVPAIIGASIEVERAPDDIEDIVEEMTKDRRMYDFKEIGLLVTLLKVAERMNLKDELSAYLDDPTIQISDDLKDLLERYEKAVNILSN